MTTESGLGTVFLDDEEIAKVKYRLDIREIPSGQEKITGGFTVQSGDFDFVNADMVFTLVLETGRKLPIWIKNPHPVAVSSDYKIAIAPH